MIDTFKNTAPVVYQKVVYQKNRTETSLFHGVWSTQNLFINHVFLDAPFSSPIANRFTYWIMQKINNTGCPKTRYTQKKLDFSKWLI